MFLVQELRAGVFTQEEWNSRTVSLTCTEALFRISQIQGVFARGYGEVRKMGSAILVPKVTPKAHPFFWSRGIEVSQVALGTRMGKLLFSTDFTLSIPLCRCDVTAFFPEGLGHTRFQLTEMHDRMGAKIHTQKIPEASRKTKTILGPILTPKKCHVEFSTLKNFQKTKH